MQPGMVEAKPPPASASARHRRFRIDYIILTDLLSRSSTMSSIAIHDLANSSDLDQHAMSSVRGGNSWLAGLGPIANVNVGINQNLNQLQNVEVNTLNNVGSIGAGFIPPNIAVSPSQWGNISAAL